MFLNYGGFMRCKKPSGSYTVATWRFFYPQCTRANLVAGTCGGRGGAYVAAVTVCGQRLF